MARTPAAAASADVHAVAAAVLAALAALTVLNALVRRALEQARGGEKAVGPHLGTRVPLRALVPGNASLHRRASSEARSRERSRRGLSFDSPTGDERGGVATPAIPSAIAFAGETSVPEKPKSAENVRDAESFALAGRTKTPGEWASTPSPETCDASASDRDWRARM